jgi:RNA polymerase sigma-70 factor (sigma-E family)
MGQDADSAVTTMYRRHYRSLVRLAALLVQDTAAAGKLVQDSFVAMHSAWRRLAEDDRALCYLHQAVVSRSRSVLRRRIVAGKRPPELPPGMPDADLATFIGLNHSALVSALWTLAPRQREILVLRYYADLPQAQIAAAMRISKRAVKRDTARAISSLRAELRRTNR